MVCAPSVSAQSPEVEAGSDSRGTSDSLAAAVMKYYSFNDYEETSDTLSLEIKPILGEYKSFYDGYSTIKTYTAIKIWWPECQRIQIDAGQLLTDIILPAIEEPASGVEQNDLSKPAYEMYLRLKNIDDPWHSNINAYSKLVEDIRAVHPIDPMPALVKSQRVSYQDIHINETILHNIAQAFPEDSPPIGIYLEYWQDPSHWTLW